MVCSEPVHCSPEITIGNRDVLVSLSSSCNARANHIPGRSVVLTGCGMHLNLRGELHIDMRRGDTVATVPLNVGRPTCHGIVSKRTVCAVVTDAQNEVTVYKYATLALDGDETLSQATRRQQHTE